MKRFLLAILVVGIVGFAATSAQAQCYRGGYGSSYYYPSVHRYNYRPTGYYNNYRYHGHHGHHHHYHRGFNTQYYRRGGAYYGGSNFGIHFRF